MDIEKLQEMSTKLSELFPIAEKSEPLSKEQLCDTLAHIIDSSIADNIDVELFVSNYVFITKRSLTYESF